MARLVSPVRIGGIRFANRLMNGSYIHSKSLRDIERLIGSACGAVVVGSISVKPRKINRGHNYWLHKERFYSLNSYGMPNGGLPYYTKYLPQMVALAHRHSKPLIANLVGFSNQEFATLIKFAEANHVDMVELNFGCPNVWENGQQKRIISYHASLVQSTLAHIAQQKPQIKIAVKISPLPPDILQEVTLGIVESGIVSVITATNSYPNASPTTGTGNKNGAANGLGGLGGRALKPISLGVVKQLRSSLPNHIDIIGCGGVSSANDVRDYLEAGAKAVQIATALTEEGSSVFEKIIYKSR